MVYLLFFFKVLVAMVCPTFSPFFYLFFFVPVGIFFLVILVYLLSSLVGLLVNAFSIFV